MNEFDASVFESMIEKIIIGEVDEEGNRTHYCHILRNIIVIAHKSHNLPHNPSSVPLAQKTSKGAPYKQHIGLSFLMTLFYARMV